MGFIDTIKEKAKQNVKTIVRFTNVNIVYTKRITRKYATGAHTLEHVDMNVAFIVPKKHTNNIETNFHHPEQAFADISRNIYHEYSPNEMACLQSIEYHYFSFLSFSCHRLTERVLPYDQIPTVPR